MKFPIPDPENYRRLQGLGLDEAIRTFIDGDFTIGEDDAILEAVRKGLSFEVSEEAIWSVLGDCLEDETDVEECKRRLLALSPS
jgi:hypothetical protein